MSSMRICLLVGFIIAAWLFRGMKKRQRSLPYPPGPAGIPILGNALQLPLVAQWIKFTEWASIYGTPMCVLTDLSVAH